MSGRAHGFVLAACAWLAGCAQAPPPAAVPDADTAWGDEYEGLTSDTDFTDATFHAARASFAADALFAPGAPVLRATAAASGFGARYRESAAGRAGAVEFAAPRVAVVAGAVRASLAEGALLADARDASSVEPRATRALEGLRLAPSSSTWGSALGAGASARLGRVHVAAGAWQDRGDAMSARAFFSAGLVRARTVVFAAAGQSRAGARVASLSAARAAGGAFVSGEAGVARDGVRVVARVVAGADGAWRALIAAGSPAAAADPSPATAAARWGGAVERRGALGPVACRVLLSTRARRDGSDVERRQRAEYHGSLAVGDARLEAAVRATRESGWSATDLLERPAPWAPGDEVRVRCALRLAEAIGARLRVEQAYRAEFVVAGAGPAGRVIGWSGRARLGMVDARVQASAFDLGTGQLAYTGRAVLPGAPTFTTLARSGIDLSASLQVAPGWGVAAGVQAVRTAAGEGRVVLHAGVAF